MTTAATGPQIVPRPSASMPALRAADRGVADALQSVLSNNTRRVYAAQWRIFENWCDSVGLPSLPGAAPHRRPLPGSACRRWRRPSPPCDWPRRPSPRLTSGPVTSPPVGTGGVRASLKGWGRRLARPQREAGALTADTLAVIRLTAPKPRARGRGLETPEQAAERARFDLALVAALSDGGLRRSEAVALTWGDVQRWDDGSGRITVVRSKTDVEAQGAVVAITPAAMRALDAIRFANDSWGRTCWPPTVGASIPLKSRYWVRAGSRLPTTPPLPPGRARLRQALPPPQPRIPAHILGLPPLQRRPAADHCPPRQQPSPPRTPELRRSARLESALPAELVEWGIPGVEG